MDLNEAREAIGDIDAQMAALFQKRMEAVRAVAEYKHARGLPVLDKQQEARKIETLGALVEDEELRPLYTRFLQDTMDVSKDLQRLIIGEADAKSVDDSAGYRVIPVFLGADSYDIVLGRGCLASAGELLKLDRNVLVVTDDGVPAQYAQDVARQCGKPVIHTVPSGEASKSLKVLEELLAVMLENGFTRGDCVCAVGGGVVGDLAGFAAATYMRGIDFYNIPTTVLSQVDSSIGGKTAVNFRGVKNIVGAFWQPKRVLIDPDTLDTLSDEQKANGMAEAVKSGLIADAALFDYFEQESGAVDVLRVIESSLRVKKAVVEADVREGGLRKILNFGHTIGHGIESVTGLLHGECVALGMIPLCSEATRNRLVAVLEGLGLPTTVQADPEMVYQALLHDKKMAEGAISVVYVDEPGSCRIEAVAPDALKECIEMVVKR